MHYKYMRIQGRELALYTNYPNGVFGIFRDFEAKNVMSGEDFQLYQEICQFFQEELPFPPMCNERQKVICFFKTEGSGELLKYMNPLLWLLERYHHPYDVIYTNFPGEIIYEDAYQIVVPIDSLHYPRTDFMDDDVFHHLSGYKDSSRESDDMSSDPAE